MAKIKGKANITVAGGDSVFQDIVRKDLIRRVFGKTTVISNNLRPILSGIIHTQLSTSPTVVSLIGGKLRDDFGLRSSEAIIAVDSIVQALSDNFEIKISRGSNQYIARLSIDLLPSGLSLSGFVTGDSYQANGGSVDWLEWLLTRGTQVIIGDYFLFENAAGNTRSGGRSIMVPIRNKLSGEPFRVDPAHAGTEASNFITRSLEPIYPAIVNMVLEEVVRVISS